MTTHKLKGNLKNLKPSLIKRITKLFHRRLEKEELVSRDIAREIYEISQEISRRIGILVSREGRIEEVFVGDKNILYLPDLGRYRLGKARLRRLRLIFADLSKGDVPVLPPDILGDLEKLRLDAVISVKASKNAVPITVGILEKEGSSQKEYKDINEDEDIDFQEFIFAVESELEGSTPFLEDKNSAIIIHVSKESDENIKISTDELKELARTAGLNIVDTIVQKREIDPNSVLGKGKLEEVLLRSIRLGVNMLIFDVELKPTQWRTIINATQSKVIDRSMLILDIFAQRAKTSEGALQVELAQLKYNMPRLVEKDGGLSRLIGGIGGRGPGETKLEIGRRRIRERITDLERKIENLIKQRHLRRDKRQLSGIPVISIVGYTNVGKSTLFNRLTSSNVIVENKLFATLDPFRRRWSFQDESDENLELKTFILSDTVGFVRDLPKELTSAFRATLEEIQESSLLLHVLDGTDPVIDKRIESVDKVLEGILKENKDTKDVRSIFVVNKADLLREEKKAELRDRYNAVVVSAISGEGVEELKGRILS